MEQKKYVDILRVKASFAEVFSDDIITITEKVDGSNASIAYDAATDTVCTFSRRQPLDETRNLNGFYEWVMSIPKEIVINLTENGKYIIFGEWLVKNKIQYPDDKYKKFYLFDVYDTETECYTPYERVESVHNVLKGYGAQLAPLFYHGEWVSWDHVQNFVGKTELGATPCGEGVVIKSQTRLTDKYNSRRPKHLKVVSEHFAEVQKTKAPIDPEILKTREAQRELAATIVTRRRIEKGLEKIRDDGIIPLPQNFLFPS
jgi:ATP-dependent RNA circularization protein (DNA/RNA ligase family)